MDTSPLKNNNKRKRDTDHHDNQRKRAKTENKSPQVVQDPWLAETRTTLAVRHAKMSQLPTISAKSSISSVGDAILVNAIGQIYERQDPFIDGQKEADWMTLSKQMHNGEDVMIDLPSRLTIVGRAQQRNIEFTRDTLKQVNDQLVQDLLTGIMRRMLSRGHAELVKSLHVLFKGSARGYLTNLHEHYPTCRDTLAFGVAWLWLVLVFHNKGRSGDELVLTHLQCLSRAMCDILTPIETRLGAISETVEFTVCPLNEVKTHDLASQLVEFKLGITIRDVRQCVFRVESPAAFLAWHATESWGDGGREMYKYLMTRFLGLKTWPDTVPDSKLPRARRTGKPEYEARSDIKLLGGLLQGLQSLQPLEVGDVLIASDSMARESNQTIHHEARDDAWYQRANIRDWVQFMRANVGTTGGWQDPQSMPRVFTNLVRDQDGLLIQRVLTALIDSMISMATPDQFAERLDQCKADFIQSAHAHLSSSTSLNVDIGAACAVKPWTDSVWSEIRRTLQMMPRFCVGTYMEHVGRSWQRFLDHAAKQRVIWYDSSESKSGLNISIQLPSDLEGKVLHNDRQLLNQRVWLNTNTFCILRPLSSSQETHRLTCQIVSSAMRSHLDHHLDAERRLLTRLVLADFGRLPLVLTTLVLGYVDLFDWV